jgi:hypothetical protein
MMTLLNDAVEQKKFDTRMVERNVARQVLSQDEVEKNLKKLPDDSENAEYTSIESLANDTSKS